MRNIQAVTLMLTLLALLAAMPSLSAAAERPDAAVQKAFEAKGHVVKLKAPQALAELLKGFGGKYVFIAHASDNIKSIKDLDGKMLMVAFIESDSIFGDSQQIPGAAGVEMMIGLQNNPGMYKQQFVKDAGTVGFMVPSVAQHYQLADEDGLVMLIFE